MKCILQDRGRGRAKTLTWENTPAPPNFHIQPRPQNTLRDTRKECRLMCETNTLFPTKKHFLWRKYMVHSLTVQNSLSKITICKHTHTAFSTFTTTWLRKKCQIIKWLQHKRKTQEVTVLSGEKACQLFHLSLFFPNFLWRGVDAAKPILWNLNWCPHYNETLQSSYWMFFSTWISIGCFLKKRIANKRLEGPRSHQLLGGKPSESLIAMHCSWQWTHLDLSHHSTK